MADLILDSLEINNFRLFQHLEIERLGRVNLIVGKNGVGKTALLEAISLYAYRGFPAIIARILEERDETIYAMTQEGYPQWFLGIGHLFNGRPPLRNAPLSLNITSAKSIFTFTFDFAEVTDASRYSMVPVISVRVDEESRTYALTGDLIQFTWEGIKCILRSPYAKRGIGHAQLWDDAVIGDREEDILTALRVIIPEVERLNFVTGTSLSIRHPSLIGASSVEEKKDSQERIPIVKLGNLPHTVPLLSMGDGLLKMLEVALTMANSKGGLALIDEIESGLHYSVQPDMWRLVFETAARLNVQVFATTHSLDCIRAFESAARERGEEESLLISLRRHRQEPEKIVAVLAGKDELDTIVHSPIEVR